MIYKIIHSLGGNPTLIISATTGEDDVALSALRRLVPRIESWGGPMGGHCSVTIGFNVPNIPTPVEEQLRIAINEKIEADNKWYAAKKKLAAIERALKDDD